MIGIRREWFREPVNELKKEKNLPRDLGLVFGTRMTAVMVV